MTTLAQALSDAQVFSQVNSLSQAQAEAYMQGQQAHTQFWEVLNRMDESTRLRTLLSLMTREQVQYLDTYFPHWQQNPEPAVTYLNQMAMRYQGSVAVSMQTPPGTSVPSPGQSSSSRRANTTTVTTRSRGIPSPTAAITAAALPSSSSAQPSSTSVRTSRRRRQTSAPDAGGASQMSQEASSPTPVPPPPPPVTAASRVEGSSMSLREALMRMNPLAVESGDQTVSRASDNARR